MLIFFSAPPFFLLVYFQLHQPVSFSFCFSIFRAFKLCWRVVLFDPLSCVSENELFKTSDSCCHSALLQTASHQCSDLSHPPKPERIKAAFKMFKKKKKNLKEVKTTVQLSPDVRSQNRHKHPDWSGTVNLRIKAADFRYNVMTQKNRWTALVVEFIHYSSQITF